MSQSVRQSSGERSSSNDDQVKKQAALDGAHMESFDRLCQVINKTADVTNCKSGEAERHFFQTPIREAKNLRRSSRTVRHKGLLSFYPFGKAGLFDSFLIFSRNMLYQPYVKIRILEA